MDETTNNSAMSPGEATDFRYRMGVVERRMSETEIRVNVHEEKCAGRYKVVLGMLVVSIGMNIPSAMPHILTFLGIMK